MSLTVYISSVSSSQEIKKHQTHIQNVLSSKKIEYEIIDISTSKDLLVKMREISGNPTAVAPQICRGDVHIGDYHAFLEAVEVENLNEFLKI